MAIYSIFFDPNFLDKLVGPVPLSTSTDSSAERSSETKRAVLYNRLVGPVPLSTLSLGCLLDGFQRGTVE